MENVIETDNGSKEISEENLDLEKFLPQPQEGKRSNWILSTAESLKTTASYL